MTMKDVVDVLYSLSRPVAVSLLFDILEDFGAVIYGRVSFTANYFVARVGNFLFYQLG